MAHPSSARTLACPICTDAISMPAVISSKGALRIYHKACIATMIATREASSQEPLSPFSHKPCSDPSFFSEIRSDETDIVSPAQPANAPIHFVFLLDVSGSMNESSKPSMQGAPSRWSLVVHILYSIIIAIRENEDNLSAFITVFLFSDDTYPTQFVHTSVKSIAEIEAAIRHLRTTAINRNTSMHTAIYAAARVRRTEITHHILLTDGYPDSADLVTAAVADITTRDRTFTMHTIGIGAHIDATLLCNIADTCNGIPIFISDLSTAPIMIASLVAHVVLNEPKRPIKYLDALVAALHDVNQTGAPGEVDATSITPFHIIGDDVSSPEAIAIMQDMAYTPTPSAGQIYKALDNFMEWGIIYLRVLETQYRRQFAADDIAAINCLIASPEFVVLRTTMYKAIGSVKFVPHLQDERRCDTASTQSALSQSAEQAGCIHGKTHITIMSVRMSAPITTTIDDILDAYTDTNEMMQGVIFVVRIPTASSDGSVAFWGPDANTPVVTSWHPIAQNNTWMTPQQTPGWQLNSFPTGPYVYHLLLTPGAEMRLAGSDITISSLFCSSFGYKDPGVFAHDYLQTDKVANDLYLAFFHDRARSHVITIDPSRVTRHPIRHTINSWFA